MVSSAEVTQSADTDRGHSAASSDAHDVVVVRHVGARGAWCKVFVDGLSCGTARYYRGQMSFTHDFPDSAHAAVARAVAEVLGA